MAFTNLVNELWTGDHADTAEAVAVNVGLTDEQREYLMPVIMNGVRIVRRTAAKRAEDIMRPATSKRPAPGSSKQEDLSNDPRLAFLEVEFALPDGRYVTWRDATVKDHEARIEMLDKMRGSLTQTIDKHRAVINQIAANRARCLGDLYPKPPSGEVAA